MTELAANTRTIGILWNPWEEYSAGRSLKDRWMRFLGQRAMVRGREYLVQLFQEHYPDQELMDFSGNVEDLNSVSNYDRVVLLYPDPIGHGFALIERALTNNKTSSQELWVLNGRRRSFALTAKVASQLHIRRLLEIVPVIECLLLGALIVFSPIVMLWNAIRRQGSSVEQKRSR